ncbi:transmembrane protein C1orf162 homolog [Marmota marmota marmota]|uniref:Chromosome 1 open reading frame 162 n=1 Tax=Marmota marmota marmota TaxID=9994 RepID=A0A8C5ZFL2_MARMA|nr:transmembrane protein C1orf162 homolog [Marmota marmota marmota]
MGGRNSKPKPQYDISSTIAPMTTSSAPCHSSRPNTADLILVFFAGVLLTLLLTAMVFLIIKSCRRCHYSPQVPDPHSDSPAKRSSLGEDPLTYASMSFQPLEKKSHSLTANHSADLDPVVYAQVKATSQ